MGQSAFYALDGLVLELDSEQPRRDEVDRLLKELCWARLRSSARKPNLYLYVSSSNRPFRLPANCRELFRADGFVGCEIADEFYLTDGSSVFHLRPTRREGYARLAPLFDGKPPLAQSNFWCFGLLKLLRPLGIYGLHAAALATAAGAGLLLVGAPGSGKSTLAIGLIRQGWKYLSDDAVLLRDASQGIAALGCRRSFYIDAVRSPDYSDLSVGNETPDSNGRRRRRVEINEVFHEQYVPQCVPRIVMYRWIAFRPWEFCYRKARRNYLTEARWPHIWNCSSDSYSRAKYTSSMPGLISIVSRQSSFSSSGKREERVIGPHCH